MPDNKGTGFVWVKENGGANFLKSEAYALKVPAPLTVSLIY